MSYDEFLEIWDKMRIATVQVETALPQQLSQRVEDLAEARLRMEDAVLALGRTQPLAK